MHGLHFKARSPHCWKAEHFLIWKNLDYGIFTWPDKSVVVSDTVLVDNKVSLALHVFGPGVLQHKFADNTITVRNSLLIGQSDSWDCVQDKIIPEHAAQYPVRRSPRPVGGGKNIIYAFLLKIIFILLLLKE